MKVGILGGSFDPVHNEHVSIAKAAIRDLQLDKLFIVPAFIPPHKRGKKLTPPLDRFNMCVAAFEDIQNAEVSDYEISGGGTSYSYITCAHFKEEYPDARLYFIVGEDMLEDFYTWKNPERILSDATLAVCRRNSSSDSLEDKQERFYKRFSRRFEEIDYNGENLSSTQIRIKAMAGEDISEYAPEKVCKYIKKRSLYIIPFAEKALSLEKPSRAAHSRRVAVLAGQLAAFYHICEYDAVLAGIMHDVAKNLPPDSPLLEGFAPPDGVPGPVVHQYSGAYVAKHTFGIENEEVLDAIRYHTSGKADMTDLGKIIFIADYLEPGREYEEVKSLRKYLYLGLDECMYRCAERMISYLESRGTYIYPLSLEAYEFYKNINEEKNK